MTDMSDTSVDIPRPDRHGHTPIGVSVSVRDVWGVVFNFHKHRMIKEFDIARL